MDDGLNSIDDASISIGLRLISMNDASISMDYRLINMDDELNSIEDKSIQMNDASNSMNHKLNSVCVPLNSMAGTSVSMNDPFESKNAPFFLSGNSVASLANGANGCTNYPGSAVGGFYQAVHTSNKNYPLSVTVNKFNLKAIL